MVSAAHMGKFVALTKGNPRFEPEFGLLSHDIHVIDPSVGVSQAPAATC